jgi:hypothetical protein
MMLYTIILFIVYCYTAQEKLQRRRKRAYKPTAADADVKLQQIEQADTSIAVKKVTVLQ